MSKACERFPLISLDELLSREWTEQEIAQSNYREGYRAGWCAAYYHTTGNQEHLWRHRKALVLWGMDDVTKYIPAPPCPPLDRKTQSYRKQIRPSTRYAVFERDGYRCRICGRGADDVMLHIDHIVPVSRGGKNAMSNLRVLCADCNHGKGAQMP